MSDVETVKDDLKKIKIVLNEIVSDDGEVVTPPAEELLDAMEEAGWTDNPATGKAVILPDGSELLNPVPVAPPVDYDTSPSAFDIWQAQLQRMANIRDLGEGFLLDDEEDAEDYDVADPEDFFVRSAYEIEMVPEAPALERALTPAPVEKVTPEVAVSQAIADGNVREEVR